MKKCNNRAQLKDILAKINIPPRLKTNLRRKRVYIPLIIIIIIILRIFVFGGGDKTELEIQTIESTKITHIVSETGTVRAGDSISLSFARSGRVAEVLVKKGGHSSERPNSGLLRNGVT